jgi:type II secretory pathway pseudopilin PulG
MSLVEVALAMGLLAILGGILFSSLLGTTAVVDTAGAITDSQLEAERVVRMIRGELQRSGVTSPADLTITTGALTLANDVVDYTAVDPSLPLFNPADPTNVPFEGAPRRILMEAHGSEILGNGVDDDGDLLIDEGQITLIQAGAPPIVLGVDISRLEFELVPGGGTSGLPTLKIKVEVARLNRANVDTTNLSAASGFRIHTSYSVFTLLN